MKLAIIRLSSLGDVLVTSAFLRVIKAQNAHVTWVVDSSFRAILENSLYIDCICDIPLRTSKKHPRYLLEIAQKLRSLGEFDAVLDFQGLLKSALIGKMIKAKEFIGYSWNGSREGIASIFYTKKAQIPYEAHVLLRAHALLQNVFCLEDFSLGMLDNRGDILGHSSRAQERVLEILRDSKDCVKILFILEASRAEKEYGADNFYELAKILKDSLNAIKIFLIWHSDESTPRDLAKKDSVFCVLPRLNFDEIKALTKSMNLVIGGDTGITHLAWLLCIPSITIFGNTPIARSKLEGTHHVSLCAREDIAVHNKTTRIKGDFSIREIPPQNVATFALELLSKRREL